MIGYFEVFFLGFLFFTFPGILFIRSLHQINLLSKLIATIFLSLGFWVCMSSYFSFANLPLNYTSLVLQILFVGYFVKYELKQTIQWFRKLKLNGEVKKIPIHYFILLFSCLMFCVPYLFIVIPPGCDTSMHGYITRLIINSNGLPHSYYPILPVDYFGSYSAGYHIITALVCGVNVTYLRYAINFISIIVYPLTLLSFVFFLKIFFSEKTAIYLSIISFGINTTIQGAIEWGGNPTVLSFGFCLFSIGIVVVAIRNKSNKVFYVSAFSIASIPLIHAIPAIAFFYISLPGYLVLLLINRDRITWVISNSVILFLLIVLLLLPFILQFKSENSFELLLMIKNWQNEMMGNHLTNDFLKNVFVTIDQIKYRIGDPLTIIAGISIVVMLIFRKFFEVLYITLFLLLISALIFNYGYWILPFSEILYPERVAYFAIICASLYIGHFLKILEDKKYSIIFLKSKFLIYNLIVSICLFIGMLKIYTTFILSIKNNQIYCTSLTFDSFEWLNDHTEKNAIIESSYQDVGMWIPTFTNRATTGAHIHFIHIVKHVKDSLNGAKAPRYIFITNNDKKLNKEILTNISTRTKVFANNEIEIYH